MKRIHYNFTGNPNQLHDELLKIRALQGVFTWKENLMEPIFEDQLGSDQRIRSIQVGEKVRQVVTVEEPKLRVESLENNIWLTVPDDFDEVLLEKVIQNHVPAPPALTMKEKIASAQTLDDIKKVLSDYFGAVK